MKACYRVIFSLAVSPLPLLCLQHSLAAEPTVEELLKPTKLSLISAGSDLAPVFAEIERQTGNKLVDKTHSDEGPLPPWNFSLSDREFWPLLDKFLDATALEPLINSSNEGLPIGRRPLGMKSRYGNAIYVGPFRLAVVEVTSRLDTRSYGDHRANVVLEVAWEPRLRPLLFTQSVGALQGIADEKTPVTVAEGSREFSVEATRDSHAVELHIPLDLPPEQLGTISSLKGRIKALLTTRAAEFRFDNLAKAQGVEKSDGGVKVVLDSIGENQGLCELHMRVEFDTALSAHVAQGNWNFQNATYLEDSVGKKIEHAGFESTSQTKHKLGLAYYFDISEGKLGEYTWVYHAPARFVEVPIDYELKDIPLP